MSNEKELVNVPTTIVGLKQVQVGDRNTIQYYNNNRKATWDLKLYYLSCSGSTAKAKAIRRKLEKIQGKKPKDTVSYGQKEKIIKEMVSSADKINKQQKKHQGKSNTSYIPSRIEILNAFRDCDTKSLSEIITEGNSILMAKIHKSH